MSAPQGQEQAHIRVHSAKALLAVLLAVKPASNKQASVVTITKDGVAMRWEDESKSLQSSVFLNSEMFLEFQVPWVRRSFGLHFQTFMDTLNVFAATATSELSIRYPGPDEELLFELVEAIEDLPQLCTYARMNTLELVLSPELTEYWQEPASYFLAAGTMLKEAIEDLEWAASADGKQQGTAKVHLKRSPPQIALSANEMANLTIKLPVGDLAGFMCTEAEVVHKYKYKLLRATFSNLPAGKEQAVQIPTKVTIDSQGIMKVTHMVSMTGAPMAPAGYLGPGGMSQSQHTGRKGWTQFILLPQDAFIEFGGDDDA